MLSYRHAFHAGNHADILKHVVLTRIIEYLKKKEKPFVYFDTHAGGGLYDLKGNEASKTGEHEHGIARLLERRSELGPLFAPYLEILKQLNPDSALRIYPGSPAIAGKLLRSQDRMALMELHSSEIQILKKNMNAREDRRIAIHFRDGFEGLVALTPPEIRRGLALMDPSYEQTEDYAKVVDTARKVLKKWPGATLAIWYPHLAGDKDHSLFMREKFRKLAAEEVLEASLCPASPQDGAEGMYGSAMMIANPTFGLKEELDEIINILLPALKTGERASGGVRYIVGGSGGI
ncbi:MAG: 23S rRNA (adenine(2030)-N(6))-methyltransferase RlmJ [Succinivibrionaceae bacterium]|nr:23S rRNA (adenine(2030)-N(6))-methyltransferase RlmJ [Succinivibrionaceae bacterium]